MITTNHRALSPPTSTFRRLRRPRRLLGLLLGIGLSILLTTGGAAAQSGTFDGPFVGLEIASQNYFGGAFVGGIDVLAQDSKIVADLSVGYRKQWRNDRLLTGLRLSFGRTDGDLTHADPAGRFDIAYQNDSQLGYGIEIGGVLRQARNLALFVYVYEVEREFEVTITSRFGTFRQTDEQTLIRFGIGAEMHLFHGLNLRAAVGRIDVDFGDLITNIDVEDKTDFGIGLIYQF